MNEKEIRPGTEAPEEDFFCQRTCPQCGKELYTVKLGFCPYCGGSLAGSPVQSGNAPGEMQAEVHRLRAEYDAMEEELEHMQNEYTHLRESFDGLLSERNRLADENTQLRRRLKEASKDLQQWMLGSQGLNLRLKEVTEEGTAAKQEVQTLKRRLETAEARKNADADAAKDALSRLQNELEALRYELRAKDTEVQKYRAVSRKVPDLEQEKTLLSEMLAQREAEIRRLREISKGKPNGSLHSGSVGEMRDEELLRANIGLKTELFTLKQQQKKVKEELSAAQEEIESLRAQRSTQEKAMQAQAEESARAIASVRQEADNELAALREELSAAQAERDSLQAAEPVQEAPAAPVLTGDAAEWQRENEQLRETIREQGKKLRSVTKQLLALKNQQNRSAPEDNTEEELHP